jgi:hypothetical protein
VLNQGACAKIQVARRGGRGVTEAKGPGQTKGVAAGGGLIPEALKGCSPINGFVRVHRP